MDIARISAILADCAGEVDDNEQPLEGNEPYNFFVAIVVLNTAKVHKYTTEMIGLLREWPSESRNQSVPPLGEKINYIIVGDILGDRLLALKLFAFGRIADWWDILDPRTELGMGYDNLFGIGMAGAGMVAIEGYSPAVSN